MAKKLILIFILILWVIVPRLTFAFNLPAIVPCQDNCTECDFFKMVQNIINIFWILVGIACVIQIIFGGFIYITSAGNEEHIKKAKQIITYAITGLVIVSLAWLIINTVMQIFNANNKGTWWKIDCSKVTFPKPAPTGPTNENVSPPPTETGDDSPYTYDPGIENQINDASQKLLALLECMRPKLPAGSKRISSISDSAGFRKCSTDEYSQPPCTHAKNSCHYGGVSCKEKGSYAVDFGAEEYSSQIIAAATACGADTVLNEGNHIHVSVGKECGCS